MNEDGSNYIHSRV